MLWILVDTPSKKDFPKISENGLSEKYFDFTSGFLPNRLGNSYKKVSFMATLSKNILNLEAKQRLFRPTIWKYDTSRWIWVEKKSKIKSW